jgi:hypothetical protein
MFGLFRKRKTANTPNANSDFDGVMARLRSMPPAEQILVGHGINLANSILLQGHGSVEKFATLPEKERLDYFQALTRTIEKMKQQGQEQSQAAAGFSLYRLWLFGAVAPVTDKALQQKITAFMDEFSRKGNLGL